MLHLPLNLAQYEGAILVEPLGNAFRCFVFLESNAVATFDLRFTESVSRQIDLPTHVRVSTPLYPMVNPGHHLITLPS